MKRIFLFIVTNLAVLALLSIVIFVIEQVFGVRLAQGGLGGLLVFAAVFGFGGALISLALSKWTAKRMMGVRVITAPQSDLEAGCSARSSAWPIKCTSACRKSASSTPRK